MFCAMVDVMVVHIISWIMKKILFGMKNDQISKFQFLTNRDHLEKISAGVRLLYLFSSRSTPIGVSRANNGLRLLAIMCQKYNLLISKRSKRNLYSGSLNRLWKYEVAVSILMEWSFGVSCPIVLLKFDSVDGFLGFFVAIFSTEELWMELLICGWFGFDGVLSVNSVWNSSRPQVVAFNRFRSTSATGDIKLAGGKILSLHVGHVRPPGAVFNGNADSRSFKHPQWKTSVMHKSLSIEK